MLTAPVWAAAADVTGRVSMPDVCSPSVSPAVVSLTPTSGPVPAPADPTSPANLRLIDQRGLRFDPRVVPLGPGQPLRFANQDPETHNVHILGTTFNRSMAPGQDIEFLADKPGIYKVVCDVHSHMRAFVVVGTSPWIAASDREGGFLLTDVPPGEYRLDVWHEMGPGLTRSITVADGHLDVGTLALEGPAAATGAARSEPVRGWSEVIDRISLTYAEALDMAAQPGGRKKARRLAEDAYYAEFEASGMEPAVGRYLGLERLSDVERGFRNLIKAFGALEDGKKPPAALHQQIGVLLLDLNKTAEQLVRDGIVDRTSLDVKATNTAQAGPTAARADRWSLLAALRRSFDGVRELADQGEPDDAASALSDTYFDAFEPLERDILAGEPSTVPALEARFNAIRGRVGSGLKGAELAAQLDGLHAETSAALDRVAAAGGGAFGTAFVASFLTIVREGVEVILILTMLITLVTKTGRPHALAAIRWGFGLGIVASLLTAVALNMLVASARGRAGELVEGLVMLTASAVLFYVSYWLISQSESKRWVEFLKRQVRENAVQGSLFALGLTAFVAVYREGAETALIYQAMLGKQATQNGLLGLVAGLGLGLFVLVGLYVVIRRASVRLPLRAFFAATGVMLFVLAVIFAGQGVFALQQAQWLKVTSLGWLGNGLPVLGLYPNVQVVSIQALLVVGALLAWGLLAMEQAGARPSATPREFNQPPATPTPTVSLGA